MTSFKQWAKNVSHHPEKMIVGEFRWYDSTNKWSIWIANGPLFYQIMSPTDGVIYLSLWEKYRLHKLLKWWLAGSLAGDSADQIPDTTTTKRKETT